MRFWTRDDKEHADWPEPRAEYVSGLADSVRHARGHIRREARRSGFTLGLAPAVILALVLAVAAFAGVSTATGAGRGVISSLKSFVVSSSSDHHGKKGGHGHDDGDDDSHHGKKGGHGHDDGDDDNHEGQYDRDCDNGDNQNQSRSLQQSDQRQLLQALTAPHPGQTARQLQLAFAAHQSAARSVSNATSDRCGGDNGGNGGGGNGGGENGGNGGGD